MAKARKTLGFVFCALGETADAAAELRAALNEMQAMGARPEAARCLAALAMAVAEFAALDMAWDLEQLTKRLP